MMSTAGVKSSDPYDATFPVSSASADLRSASTHRKMFLGECTSSFMSKPKAMPAAVGAVLVPQQAHSCCIHLEAALRLKQDESRMRRNFLLPSLWMRSLDEKMSTRAACASMAR